MSYFHEIIQFEEKVLAWTYLFSNYNFDFFDTHWHRDLEICYVFKGVCKIAINGHEKALEAGDLLVVNSGDTHRFQLHYLGPCDAVSIIIPYEFLKQRIPNYDSLRFETYPCGTAAKPLEEDLKAMIPILRHKETDEYFPLLINSLLYRVIYSLLGCVCLSETPKQDVSLRHKQQCQTILDYIETHFKDDISLEDAAHNSSFCKEYFARFVKENLGITFKQYLTELRLNEAYRMLTSTDITVLQIALDCGFPNCKSFITSFKRKYSVTPQTYRLALKPNE